MEPMYLSIQQRETGYHIRQLLKEKGYTVKDIQGAMGFENPQAIYKWLSGKSLPSLDNLLILSRVLHTSMEDILVVDGGVVFCSFSKYTAFLNQQFNDNTSMKRYTYSSSGEHGGYGDDKSNVSICKQDA